MERHEALIMSSHVRLRPILMTTISIVAGMAPIALGRGAGAGSRASMAITIIGGQMLCLLLTLLVTPVVYSYFDDLREWTPSRIFARIRRRATQAGTASFFLFVLISVFMSCSTAQAQQAITSNPPNLP